LQAMKHGDSLLLAWQTTISRKGDDAAIFDTAGKIARTFQEIEDDSRTFEAKTGGLLPGAVVAVQIGNHEDWPAIFIACLRKQLVFSTAGSVQRRATAGRSIGDLQSERCCIRRSQQRFSANPSTGHNR
jgi:hypothetical protein